MNADRIATWVAIAATAGTGFIWVGAQGQEQDNQGKKIEKLEQLPIDVAVLKTQSEQQTKTLEEIKALLEQLRRNQ